MSDAATRLTREQRQLAALLLRKRGIDPALLPIPRREDPTRAPLSPTQQRLWTSGRNAIGTSYGNVPIAFRLRGSLDADCVGRALSLVVARHEILRTTYALESGEPVQRIQPPAAVAVPVEDLRSLPLSERERDFETRVTAEARRPFNLEVDALLRAKIFRLDVADWGLVMVSHHIATDGWGARLLLDELSAAYGALAEGRQPNLPPLSAQYGDYAGWEVERLESGELDSQRRYWVERLAGAPRQLRLPFDFSPSDSVATESVDIALTREMSEELRRLSRARGVTPYVTLLAALNALFHRYEAQRDVVVGTILSRRTRSETEPLIGNFGNNLLFRTGFDGDPTLAELIDRTAATMRDALAHSDVPLEVVAQVAPIPAFHVMFILRDGSYEERLALRELSVEPVPAVSSAATLDLILDITDGSRGIEGHLEYRTARFARRTIDSMATAFLEIVTQLVREPQTRVSAFSPLPISDPVEQMNGARRTGEEPATPTEKILARLWREWLEIETVYRDDNFFHLGGDSLRAVYTLERAERELGYRFHPDDLSRSTLRELGALSDGRVSRGAQSDASREAGVTVRRVNPLHHADDIKSLFERERFPHLVEFFDRAYSDAKDMSSWVALDDTGVVVGHIAMFPHRFAHNDTEYVGGLGANLVMDHRYRNLTNAMALVQTMVKDVEHRADVDFLFGDPNEEARAIMASVGGVTDAGILARFVLPVAQPGILGPVVGAYLRVKFRRSDSKALTVERRNALDFDVEEVERPPGTSTTLRPVHPPELYRRRLAGYPAEGDYWYVFTREAERVGAVLIRQFRSGTLAQLCSVWRPPGVSLVELLPPIVSDLRAAGVTRLQTSSLVDSSFGRELRAAGFWPRESGPRFIGMPCSPRGRVLLEGRVDWEITDLDCDRGLDQ